MLDLMRRQSYLIYLVFGGIIFIFAINFGPGSSGCTRAGQQPWAAKVDGEPIRQHDFALLYQRQFEYMKRLAQRSGADIDPETADRMGLRKQVLDQLVERKLLAREAITRGLEVSDDELIRYLRDEYGVKDVSYETYENWVTRTFDSSVPRFEENTRADIAAQRMAHLVSDSVAVGDDELKHSYKNSHDRALVSFARFDPELNKVQPTEADIDKLLAENASQVEAKFKQDQLNYRTSDQVHVLQILRKAAPGSSNAAMEQAQKEILAIRDELGKGADFAALAGKHAEGDSPKGGDMGWVSRHTLTPKLEDAAFALKVNDYTREPVRSPLGFHLLKVVEKKDAVVKEFAQVKREVAQTLLRERLADAQAQAQADALLAALKSGKGWSDVTREENEHPTDLAGKLKSGLKNVLKSVLPGSDKPLQRESSWMTRNQERVPGVGLSTELRAAIFELSQAKPVAPKVYHVSGSYFVVRLKDREVPDMSKFDGEKEALLEQALTTKRSRVLHDWLAHLRNQAKVQMNPGMMGGA